MKTKYFFFAALVVGALASCSEDEFTMDTSPTKISQESAPISFKGGAQYMTRSTSDDITKLAGNFMVAATKTVGTSNQKVIDNYKVWNKASGATDNTTNRYGWEYVGDNGPTKLGEGEITLEKNQSIKYWDLSASVYHYVAGSPTKAFTFKFDDSNVITGATITGIRAHVAANPKTDVNGTAIDGNVIPIGAVYVADPIVLNPNGNHPSEGKNYENAVKFSFTGQQALVRVGVYETIPGYKVTSIDFYPYIINGESGQWSNTKAPYHNIILNSLSTENPNYFIGGTLNATLTYDWSETPSYSFSYSEATSTTGGTTTTTTTTSNSWYGGSLYLSYEKPLLNTSSSTKTTMAQFFGTDKEMQESGYFPVMPTATGVANSPLVLKCDFTLTSTDGSGETIEVKGATAAIPANFSQWEVNHAYTYLFKISDKTAGAQGVLYPIQFDAMIVDGKNNRDGFITTVSVPSITSYQFASPYTTLENDQVSEVGIKYVTGTPIYVTVQDNAIGELKSLSALDSPVAEGMIKVYYLGTDELTESDLQVNRPTEHADVKPATSIPTTAWSLHGKSFNSPKYMTFTANTAGYYAVEYVNTASPVSYAYKVIKVETAP